MLRLTKRILAAVCVLLAAGLAQAPAHAEDPIPTALETAGFEGYLGLWKLSLDVMGREMELFMTLTDLDGKIGGTLDSARQPEPLAITEMQPGEDGAIDMHSEFKFGSFGLEVDITLEKDGDNVKGRIEESSSSLFAADFTGVPFDPEELDSVQGRRPAPTEARIRLDDGSVIKITFSDLSTEDEDFAKFTNLSAGNVYTYTSMRASKLWTDVDLQFGDAVIKTENAAPDYPGVYSVWLKKTTEGWNLIFNEEADVWGTSYNPETNVAEVPLEHRTGAEPVEKFLVELDRTEGNEGQLRIAWADHEWTTKFTYSQ